MELLLFSGDPGTLYFVSVQNISFNLKRVSYSKKKLLYIWHIYRITSKKHNGEFTFELMVSTYWNGMAGPLGSDVGDPLRHPVSIAIDLYDRQCQYQLKKNRL